MSKAMKNSSSRDGRASSTADDGFGVGLLLRHWKKILLIPTLSISLGLAIVLFWPRTYRSEAKLFLQVGRESVGLDPTATTGQTINLMQSGREDEIKSAIELMTGREVISAVVDQLSPEFVLGHIGPGAKGASNPVTKALKNIVGTSIGWLKSIDPVPQAEEAIVEVERNLDATAERGSTVIVCRYEADSPELAKAVLAAIVAEYRKEHLRVHRNQDSLTFFIEQQDELREHLDDVTKRVRDAKNELKISSVDGRRSTLEQQLHQVELAHYEAEQERATAESRIEELERQLEQEPETLVTSRRLVPNSGADLMREQLYALRVREKDLQARYSSDHPLLAAIQNQVAEAQGLVEQEEGERAETTNRINPIHQSLSLELKQLQGQLAGLLSRLDTLAEQKKGVLERLQEINSHQIVISQLELEEQVARNSWLKYTDNLEQARIDQERASSRISNISLAQAPTLAHRPVKPSKVLVLLGSLFLAGSGTLAAVAASERSRQQKQRASLRSDLGREWQGDAADGRPISRPLAPR